MTDATQPLTAEVDGDRLVISIGVAALAIVAQASDDFDEDGCRVVDNWHFATAIARGLTAHDGDGLTPLHDAIDEAVTLAIEDDDNGLVFDEVAGSDDDESGEV